MTSTVALKTLFAETFPAIRAKCARMLGIAEKGMPAVVVYLKRGDRVAARDGRTPLRKADSLRFQIAKGPYDYASIATVARGDRTPVVLWSGQLEKAGTAALLPISFRVDDQDAAEVVSLVLSFRPVSPSDHGARHDDKPSLRLWKRVLVFPKESAPLDAAAAPERTP